MPKKKKDKPGFDAVVEWLLESEGNELAGIEVRHKTQTLRARKQVPMAETIAVISAQSLDHCTPVFANLEHWCPFC